MTLPIPRIEFCHYFSMTNEQLESKGERIKLSYYTFEERL